MNPPANKITKRFRPPMFFKALGVGVAWRWGLVHAVFIFFATGGLSGWAAEEPPQRFSITAWSVRDGLPSDSITALARSSDGYLWVGTERGAARFDGVRFTKFDAGNCPALPSSQIIKIVDVGDDCLLFATARGGLAELRDGEFKRLLDPTGEWNDLDAILKLQNGDWLLVAHSGAMWTWSEAGGISPLVTHQPFNRIYPGSVCQDAAGTIWLLSQRGLGAQLLRLEGSNLVPFPLPPELGQLELLTTVTDREGRLWLGTSGGLVRREHGEFQFVDLPDAPFRPYVRELNAARDGGIWVRTPFIRRKLREGAWVGSSVEPQEIKTLVRHLGEDRWGRILLGGYHEGMIFATDRGGVTRLTPEDGLPGRMVSCFLSDPDGSYWLGLGDGGLARLRPQLFRKMVTQPAISTALSLGEDRGGALWVATSMGGIYQIPPMGVVRFFGNRDFPLARLVCVLPDSKSNVWLASWYGVFRFNESGLTNFFPKEVITGPINALFEDSRGDLWIGNGIKLWRWDGTRLQNQVVGAGGPAVEVRCFAEDKSGRIFIGTQAAGLWCRQGDQFQPVPTPGLEGNALWSLWVDAEDTLWIGTDGGGLGYLRSGRFSRVTAADGLWDNTIGFITDDRLGRLWMSSPRGVFRVAKDSVLAYPRSREKKLACVGYDDSDGMPSAACAGGLQPAGVKTRAGEIFFPTLKGVCSVAPETIRDNPVPPPVRIEEILIDGVPAKFVQPSSANPNAAGQTVSDPVLSIPPGKTRLEIHYTELSFSDPNKVGFKYRLAGLDRDWVDAGAKRSADYSYLRPGQYRFHVIACNSDGVWNETGATLAITLRPHFYETGWFLFLLVLGGIFAVALVVRRVEKQKHRRRLERLQHEREIDRERTRIAQDLHDDLGASLTQLAWMGASAGDPQQPATALKGMVEQMTAKSREMVQAIDEIVWAVNPKNDSLDNLATYICRFAEQFFTTGPTRCRVDVQEPLPLCQLGSDVRHNLFLTVKEALHNVAKHAQAKEVWVRVRAEAGTAIFSVEDDGRGFDPGGRAEGDGLENMRQRAEAIGAILTLKSTPGRGTTVAWTLPLAKDDKITPRGDGGSSQRMVKPSHGDQP